MYSKKTYSLIYITLFLITNCTEQHNPQPHWAQLRKEQALANRPTMRLTSDGRVPGPEDMPPQEEEVSGIAAKYQTLCASCHGAAGKADSPTAMALNPRPRNFTDSDWQKSVSDEHIGKVIRYGGGSVGLSATMAPWGKSLLSDNELQEMIQHIRTFGE